MMAHADLESITLERDLQREKIRLEHRYAELVYDGLWFSPLRDALDAFVDSSQAPRHRRGPAQAGAEPLLRGRASGAPLALRLRPRHLRRRGPVPPRGLRGFRADLGPGCADLVGRPGTGVGRLSRASDADADGRQQLWHGRFESGPAAELVAFTESLSYDQRLHLRRRRLLQGPRPRAPPWCDCSTTSELAPVLGALDAVEMEYRDGSARADRLRRGRPHADRATGHRARRRRRSQAAHRAVPQRPGRDRVPSLRQAASWSWSRTGCWTWSRCWPHGPTRRAPATTPSTCPATPTCSRHSLCCWRTT